MLKFHSMNNVVIVGASRGIGLELTRIFSRLADFNVIALSRNIENLKIEFSSRKNVSVHCFNLEGNVHQQLSAIPFPKDGINYLVNNAGNLLKSRFEDISPQDFEKVFQINAIGVMQTVQSLLPKFDKNFCHIVNISSMGAFQGSVKFPGLIAYGASKAAICNFTELFAVEYAHSSIKMNCLCLGAVETEMFNEAFPGFSAPITANEMASFIVDFTINNGKFMNGKILPVSLSTP